MMTIDWRLHWWKPGFALAFFAVGVPFWMIPYSKANLPDALFGAGLVVVAAAAALARAFSGKSFMHVVAVTGSAVPAAVLVRVLIEVLRDPTAHNLWPFEVVIAILVGGAAALAGALPGSVVLWLVRRGRQDGPGE